MKELLDRFAGKLLRSSSTSSRESKESLETEPIPTEDNRRAEFISLLRGSNGQIRQADIVAQTEWSAATVSRELSEMETEGLIHKTRVGRTNVILLAGEEPDWYTPPEDPHTANGATQDHDGQAILLIEDQEQEIRLLKEAFSDVGITNPVHTIRDGTDAVDYLLRRGRYESAPIPRLVLLDLGLVSVDGLDVLYELNNQESIAQFPIIVLSHSDDPTDIRRCYESGASAYLTKPNDLTELTDLASAIDQFWLSSTFKPPRPTV